MTREGADHPGGAARSHESPVQVVSAHGGLRIVLVLLAVWTFVEGFALSTGTINALTLGGSDRTAERVIGAHMILLVPIYVLLAFQRERYRMLIWMPYAAQLAIILPVGWSIIRYADFDGVLLLIVAASFLSMLVYFWWHSHDPEFFQTHDEEEHELAAPDDAGQDDESDDDDGPSSSRRYRRR